MMKEADWKLAKRKTGIPGLDQATDGGLPSNQATLILGYSGTGKTTLALQILAHAIANGEGGILVTFEESADQLKRDANSFSWGKDLNRSNEWTSIDARLPTHADSSGGFDIDALLNAVEHQSKQFSNPWIILDGIDQLMQYQAEPTFAINQIRRLNEKCEKNGWTVLLTGKVAGGGLAPQQMEGLEFLLSTTILLTAKVVDQRLVRQLRIAKYRGSKHHADEVPLIINEHGIILPYHAFEPEKTLTASTERVSTGIARLDDVLDGGIYRGSSLLISGRPGTSKSSLSAAFAEAAAKRGEKTLYVSFDEMEAPYVRNLRSININLQPLIDDGLIKFHSRSAWSALVSEHLLSIQKEIEDFDPDHVIIDPISALLKSEVPESSRFATEWLLEITATRNITTILTSLTAPEDSEGETTLASASTIADAWIVLDYNVRAGERNRSLSVVKCRGSAHSNQQRELIMSDDGIDLADVYEYGTEVLMGTARIEMEAKVRAQARREEMENEQKKRSIKRRMEASRSELESLRAELELIEAEAEEAQSKTRQHTDRIKQRRSAAPRRKDQEGEPR